MRSVTPHTAAVFGRALVMPNLRPPVTTTQAALAYRGRVLDATPCNSAFQVIRGAEVRAPSSLPSPHSSSEV